MHFFSRYRFSQRRLGLGLSFLCAAVVAAQAPAPIVQTVLYSITASDLKGDLSFIASDALLGRYTPSYGLDVAAEYIASEYRAAGLEPGGDQDYFQTTTMVDRHMAKASSPLTVNAGSQSLTIPAQALTVLDQSQAVKVDHAPLISFAGKDPDALKGVDLRGKVILVLVPAPGKLSRDAMIAAYHKARAFDKAVAASNAAMEIMVSAQKPTGTIDKLLLLNEAGDRRVPVISVESDALENWANQNLSNQAAGTARTASLELPAPDDRRVVLKNVVGILRGSDPNLKDTCVMLTAHYDHIGTTETAGRLGVNRTSNPSDHIYNGANDDGSGTVSVIEIAKALAKLNPHPKRSIVFVTFFGEERGELGSEYYARHPVFPLAKTVADVNLEQVGRTDSTNGRQLNDASLTGFDYSNVTKFFEEAGRETGIRVYMDKEASGPYFTRSDNAALAEAGVPAHSLTVAFDYPDYHGLGDRWQKIDYENMARVDRMIALGVVDIANSATAPQWNAQNPKTLPFREAQRRSRAQRTG